MRAARDSRVGFIRLFASLPPSPAPVLPPLSNTNMFCIASGRVPLVCVAKGGSKGVGGTSLRCSPPSCARFHRLWQLLHSSCLPAAACSCAPSIAGGGSKSAGGGKTGGGGGKSGGGGRSGGGGAKGGTAQGGSKTPMTAQDASRIQVRMNASWGKMPRPNDSKLAMWPPAQRRGSPARRHGGEGLLRVPRPDKAL